MILVKGLQQNMSVKDIVSKNQCNSIISNKLLSDNKCIRKSSRLLLHCI